MPPKGLVLIIITLIITIILISILLRSRVYNTLYQPLRRKVKRNTSGEYEELYIDTRRNEVYYSDPHIVRNRIHCWHMNKFDSSPVIYYLHGNNTDLHSCRFMIEVCKVLKYNLFMIDYRGFGRSSLDFVTHPNMIEDAEAGYSFLQQRYAPSKITVWGTSLGGHVALHLASHHPIHSLILLSTYSTLHNMFNDMSLPRSIVSEPLKALTSELNVQTTNMRLVKKVKCKTIFIHSKDDELIPFHHSKLLYNKMNKHVQKELIQIKGPHDGPVFTPSQFKSLLKFIDCPIYDLDALEKLLMIVHAIEPTKL